MSTAFIFLLSLPASVVLVMTTLLLVVYLLHRQPSVTEHVLPAVSVLIPFYNEQPDLLLKALTLLDAQHYPQRLQIILIDDGSTNDAPARVAQWLTEPRHHDFLLLQRPINGGRKGYALDHALDSGLLRGEVHVVVDSDTFVAPDGVYELVKKLWSDPKYAAVCGYITPENHQGSLIGKLQYYEHIGYYGAIRAAQDKLGMVPVLAGAFVAHRASVVRELGGWSEWLVEDISWCWKAIAMGYRTGYAARAMATTQCPETTRGLLRQRRRWARGRVEALFAAWQVAPSRALLMTPWFLVTALQYLFPPTLLLLPLLAWFQIWLPFGLICATLVLYMVFALIYQRQHRHKLGIPLYHLLQVPFFTAVLELYTWLPNLLGYFDEFLGRKKSWLTR